VPKHRRTGHLNSITLRFVITLRSANRKRRFSEIEDMGEVDQTDMKEDDPFAEDGTISPENRDESWLIGSAFSRLQRHSRGASASRARQVSLTGTVDPFL
jgi:hypothetical protein